MVLSNDRAATFLIIALFIGLTLLNKFKIYYKFFALLTILFSILITLTIFPSVKNRYMIRHLLKYWEKMITEF